MITIPGRPISRALPLALAALLPASASMAQCFGDLNCDHAVNGADLGLLQGAWDTPGSAFHGEDLNGDGTVNGADLGLLLGAWGECPPVSTPAWATLVEPYPDPMVVTDAAWRNAIAATGLAWRVRDTQTQVELLLVPPGSFQMGCIVGSDAWQCYDWEQPVHLVTLTRAFYLGRFEVTQSQWAARMGSNPSYFQAPSDEVPAALVQQRPVEQVSWDTVHGYLAATGLRLPTEAQWEYACRAGTQTPYYNGSTDDATLGALAWFGSCCGGNSGGQTHPVGGKAANALGFHDMLGNVWEWVSDWWGDYPADPQTDPAGPERASVHLFRGGSWYLDAFFARSSIRYHFANGTANSVIGFRVARDP